MSDINEKLKQVELAIALEVKRICDENKISYFIDFGTLLGAVRHKGFIPWDDDFDFGMLRPDYEEFLKIANRELPDTMFLQTFDTDENYGLPFAKVRMKGTEFLESTCVHSKASSGIYVDIFPYDNFNLNDKKHKKIQVRLLYYLSLMKIKSNIRPWDYRGFRLLSYLKYFPFIVLSKFYSRDLLITKYKYYSNYYNKETNCKNLFCNAANMFNLLVVNKMNYVDHIELPFENFCFLAPKEYDLVLKDYYGDYLKLPEIVDRRSTHDVIRIKFKGDLSEFKCNNDNAKR